MTTENVLNVGKRSYRSPTDGEREYLERLWIRRIARVIADMPSSLELVAYDGQLAICKRGALREFLNTEAAAGTADSIEVISHRDIRTHSESL